MAPSGQPSPSAKRRFPEAWKWLVHVYQREIWRAGSLKEHSLKSVVFAVLRVVSISVTVFVESRIATRAAALSFSSLLGLGPLLVIAVLVAGFALGQNNDPNLVAKTLNGIITVIAPQMAEYEDPNQVNPQLVDVINNIIASSKSGSAGAAGIFSLLAIVLLLFKSIEDTFNDIWGVRQGRSMLMRIVLYWTILTLGALLFFSAVAMLGASTYLSVFGTDIDVQSLGFLVQGGSFALLAVMLTFFYRVVPNTRVFWRAAFVGALVVAVLLLANNFVTFLYVKRVVLEKSLYGSLAILPVLMFGLYIFWLFVLIGAVVSYALQNVHFRNSQAAWSTLTDSMRERLALVVFLTICRRFRDCLPPISASTLGTLLKVPTQLLNECLNRLVRLELVTTLRPKPNSAATDFLYQPARPLNRITLFDFKVLDDNLGDDPIGNSFEHIDPLVSQYEAALRATGEQPFFQKTVEELLNETPFDESRPPFALGERRPHA